MVKKRKKAQFKALKVTLTVLLSLCILVFVATAGVTLAMIKNAPPLDVNQILTVNEPSVLYDDKDKFMDVVITTEQRTVIPFKDMPQDLKNAFVSIEDERFYKHNGIDLKRITGATLINLKNKISKQSGLQGASTITQQLLKNTLLSSEVSFKRKVQEIYLAIKLEKQLTKDQILEAYMNTIYLGGRAWGVEAASQQYFNTNTKNLNLIQCAFIAGVPQSPSVYYPYSNAAQKDPSIYLNRTKSVLKKMYENGYISQPQYDTAISDLSNNKLAFAKPAPINNKLQNEWFSIPAIEQVKKDLKSQYRYSDAEVQHLLMYGGLKIYTTMDKDLQSKTIDTLTDDSLFGYSSTKDNNGIIQPQAAAVVMDYHNGEVKSLVGGRGDQPARSFNRAASEKYLRPAGSSIKPLTVYGAAIDSKQDTAATVFEDAPLEESVAKMYGSANQPYYPQNENLEFNGNMTLRQAITKSVNVIAVKVVHQLGLKTSADYAEKFGLTLDEHDRTSISALALGQLHHGTNPLTMAAAYGVFGNNGRYTYPKMYRKVLDRNGKTILENKKESKKVLSPESAYIIYDMLKGPVSAEGTGPRANFGNMPVRGKTGTSGDKKDLWFSGLTPYYSAAVWIGNDDNTVLRGRINSNTSAALWASVISPFHQDLPPKDIEIPSGVVNGVVCSASGKLPSSSCYSDPTGNKTYSELFIEGTVPSDYCNLPHSWVKDNPLLNNPLFKPFKQDKNTITNTNENNGKSTNTNDDTKANNPAPLKGNDDNTTEDSNNNDNIDPNKNINPKKPSLIN